MSTRREVILFRFVRNVKPGVYAICWVRLEVGKTRLAQQLQKINIAV